MNVLVSINLPETEENVFQRMNGEDEVEWRAVLSIILRPE